MEKYIKLFNNNTDYQAYMNSGSVVRPNTCYCYTENELYYNKLQTAVTIGMTGGDSVIIKSATGADGSQITNFTVRTGEEIQVLKGTEVTARLTNRDTTSGFWWFQYKNGERVSKPCTEELSFTITGDGVFWGDID